MYMKEKTKKKQNNNQMGWKISPTSTPIDWPTTHPRPTCHARPPPWPISKSPPSLILHS